LNLIQRGIISSGLILLAVVTGYTPPSGFSLVDKLFLMIGISPWSNGQTGFHNTIFVTFSLLIIGILEAKRFLGLAIKGFSQRND